MIEMLSRLFREARFTQFVWVIGTENYFLLGIYALWYSRCLPTFRRDEYIQLLVENIPVEIYQITRCQNRSILIIMCSWEAIYMDWFDSGLERSRFVSCVVVLLRCTYPALVAHVNMYYTERVWITYIKHKHLVLRAFCSRRVFKTRLCTASGSFHGTMWERHVTCRSAICLHIYHDDRMRWRFDYLHDDRWDFGFSQP
jgi:hypothetical protein